MTEFFMTMAALLPSPAVQGGYQHHLDTLDRHLVPLERRVGGNQSVSEFYGVAPSHIETISHFAYTFLQHGRPLFTTPYLSRVPFFFHGIPYGIEYAEEYRAPAV